MSCLPHAFLMLMFSCQPAVEPGPSATDPLENILQHNSTVMGGNQAWEQVDNLRIQLDIREPAFEVSGTYIASRNMGMRIDIESEGERVFAEGLHQANSIPCNSFAAAAARSA